MINPKLVAKIESEEPKLRLAVLIDADNAPAAIIKELLEEIARASFGSYLSQLQSDFDSRLYGSKKLSDLVKANTDIFQLEERSVNGSGSKVLYVRVKQLQKS
jgi:hypothetical protein